MIALTSKYALKVLIAVANCGSDRYVRIKDLANSIEVPGSYLAKIVKTLVKAGYLEGRKGPNGGVRISNNGFKATFHEICELMNEPILKESCFLSSKQCNSKAYCSVHARWTCMRKEILGFLKTSRICDRIARSKGKRSMGDRAAGAL